MFSNSREDFLDPNNKTRQRQLKYLLNSINAYNEKDKELINNLCQTITSIDNQFFEEFIKKLREAQSTQGDDLKTNKIQKESEKASKLFLHDLFLSSIKLANASVKAEEISIEEQLSGKKVTCRSLSEDQKSEIGLICRTINMARKVFQGGEINDEENNTLAKDIENHNKLYTSKKIRSLKRQRAWVGFATVAGLILVTAGIIIGFTIIAPLNVLVGSMVAAICMASVVLGITLLCHTSNISDNIKNEKTKFSRFHDYFVNAPKKEKAQVKTTEAEKSQSTMQP